MTKILDLEVERLINHFSSSGLSYKAIVDKVKLSGHKISKTTVHNVVHGIGKTRTCRNIGLPSPKKSYPSKTVSKPMIRKVDIMTDKENPPTQTAMADKLKVSRRTIGRIIKEKLGKKVKKKTAVHALKPSHVANRKANCIKLYKDHLAGAKSEFVVTLDEALFYLQDCKNPSPIYYHNPEKTDPEYVSPKLEKFSDKFMVVGALSGRGPLPLIRVPPNVKINSDYYIQHVLKPLLETEVPKLYPGETDKVFVHHDAAPSHTSHKTTRYGEELQQKLGISLIHKSMIPVKSPDTSPMDFYGFGLLKQRLQRRRATTLDGVWKILKQEWCSITLEEVTKVYNSWKRRLRLVNQMGGAHIEQTKKIHKRKL
jgi:hypothetical protein